ncbi:septal ring lytic transglycosylase RlpA family protein [Campylobacter sp. RKI_CA19_01128]|uniref:septal ring lytic transglycosylase RlpA family protein n=1 Tax=unclassified Campylobacter TaxID=2593542 RepID=UPI0021E7F0C5|nr:MULTISPECIES: septal ring lytic transglycosylase RlpA family protein [unclassified Campylobacter]MCV3349429.1 septal ring lytic transglycosylase RlpA family protein [Campylobacter sp. RKI_CA19_01127]MCV3355453.1 septal ring lytic transglycosylase RlpA family protein [Campylobacter sp. RKI_CA19_01128]HEC1776918.1 septal ring lytic transglycosylase RlpA family protein [Campylobacter lari]HEC1790957.1 septal ring lytic transglycosylase RlpA family protein [Campylobacter lari]
MQKSKQLKKYPKALIQKSLVVSCVGVLFSACSMVPISTPTVYYPERDFKSVKHNNTSLKGTMKPYTINGKTYYPTVVEVGETADGIASWYGPGFHGKKTSNGETYDQHAYTAAHKTLPMNTIVKVTNLKNHRQTTVRINDRGPFVAGRIIDLSNMAARDIDMIQSGTAPVRLEVIGFGTSASSGSVHTNSNLGSSGEIADSGHIFQGGSFMVQIGAFRNKSGAELIAGRYKNYNSYTSTIQTSAKDGLHRVFLKGFRSEQEARDFVDSGSFPGAFIVRE